jgi:hypothetical protein
MNNYFIILMLRILINASFCTVGAVSSAHASLMCILGHTHADRRVEHTDTHI